MKTNRCFSMFFVLALGLGLTGNQARAQQPHSGLSDTNHFAAGMAGDELPPLLAEHRTEWHSGFALMPASYLVKASGAVFNITPMAAGANLQVLGSGTIGRLTKWTGLTISNSFIGDTTIFEDKNGLVGIGTDTPTSKLTVAGMIEITLGGLKFPDGTIQTTAGLTSVFHDVSLMGNGTSASPLGIALGGVQSVHLANGAVTTPKIANGTVVRSLNNLFDNVQLAAGSNITITPSGSTLTIAAPNSLTSIAHDGTLAGNGTPGSPLGVASGGIGTTQLANNAVTLSKIAPGQVVTDLNGLTDAVTLTAGPNITITPAGNTLTIGATTGSSAAFFSNQNITVGQLDNPGQDVVSKAVPAGNYIIFASVNLTNHDDDDQNVICTLSTGASIGIRIPKLQGANSTVATLQDAAILNSQTTITMHCTGFKVLAFSVALSAIKVDAIQ